MAAEARASKRTFLEIGLSCLTDEAFLDAIREAVENRSRLTVSFINPDYVLRGHKTAGLVGKMNEFDIVLPDGWGIVLGGRLLGLPVPDRQGNDDICPKMFTLSAAVELVSMRGALRMAATRQSRSCLLRPSLMIFSSRRRARRAPVGSFSRAGTSR